MSNINDLCKRCGGACCKVQLFSEDWLQATGAKEVHYDGEKGQYKMDGYICIDRVCDHLKDGLCGIYEDRPFNCKQFKVGSEKCLIAIKASNPALYKILNLEI